MAQDLFGWVLGTSIIVFVVSFALGFMTSSDAVHLVVVCVIVLAAIISAVRAKVVSQSAFRTGGSIALASFVTIFLMDSFRSIGDALVLAVILVVAFVVGGSVAYWVSKR